MLRNNTENVSEKNDTCNATFIVILVAILGIFIWDIFASDQGFSEYENRILQKRPTLSSETILDGSLMKNYETYLSDQFIMRNQWISLKTLTDLSLGHKEINGVYIGKNHFLIEKHTSSMIKQEQIDKKIALLEKLTNNYSQTKIMLIPTSDQIYAEYLPPYVPYYDQNLLFEQLRNSFSEDSLIKVQNKLITNKKGDTQDLLYYKTDHHWTTMGAYLGYLAFCENMGFQASPNYLTKITDNFKGTLHSKTNLWVQAESIYAYQYKESVSVKYDFGDHITDSLYEESYLSEKNKYGYFLDDNHAFIEIQKLDDMIQNDGEGDSILVIKDSYANCFVPYLLHHYKKIYVVDLRYYRGRLFSLIEELKKDSKLDVLVLYNVVHFVEEFQYY